MRTSDDPPCSTRPRPRGRPRAFDRDAALAKAALVFWLKGYEATSMSDLTEAMGIGSPSLYAAFGSKEALYAEALQHYCDSYKALGWSDFSQAATARAAVQSWLMTSAAFLTGSLSDTPTGCMVTLSAVGSEGYPALGELVRNFRNSPFMRVKARIEQGIAEGELPESLDAHSLARFVQTVQSGMSILARDEVGRDELEAVAHAAMLGWDARVAASGA